MINYINYIFRACSILIFLLLISLTLPFSAMGGQSCPLLQCAIDFLSTVRFRCTVRVT